MSIELQVIIPDIPATQVTFYAMVKDTDCPVIDFLDELETSDPASFETLTSRIQHYSQHGIPTNDVTKVRCIDRTHKIFELKTSRGSRITFFRD